MYGFKRKVNLSHEEAVDKVREELKKEGFGVLTEIDVKAILEKRLGINFDKYVILGACNPPYAYKTLQAEPDIGLMLPCNVIVYEKEGKTYVSAIKPTMMMQMIDNPELKEISIEVESKLKRIIDNLYS